MGSDGAPVMLGRRSGVRVRLSEELPDILALHCMAFEFALSFFFSSSLSLSEVQHAPRRVHVPLREVLRHTLTKMT